MILKFEKIILRDFTECDIADKIRWINDPLNNAYLHYDIPLCYDKTLEWFRNKNNNTRHDFIVEYEGISVGVIGFLNIDRTNSKAEYYICVGESNYKGKGIATIATKLLLSYGFNILRLNKIYLNVDSKNIAACRLYEKTGFLCEGEFKKDLMHRGEYIDRKRYAILKENFQNEHFNFECWHEK